MASDELTIIEDRLLRLADSAASGSELEEATGIPAAEAILKVKEILERRDFLTELEKQKMNIMALQKVKAAMLDRVSSKSAVVEDVEAFIKATKVMDELLDKTTQITDDQLEKITRTQMQALVTMMSMAWDRTIEVLEERYPDAEVRELTDTFNSGLREAAIELDVNL